MGGLRTYAAQHIDVEAYEPVGLNVNRSDAGSWFFGILCQAKGAVANGNGLTPLIQFRVEDTWENFNRSALGELDVVVLSRFMDSTKYEITEYRDAPVKKELS